MRNPTFNLILEDAREQCARHLWLRARTASRLAKKDRSRRARNQLYAIKATATSRAFEVHPEAMWID